MRSLAYLSFTMELLLVGDVWWMESHFLALSPMSWKCLDINLRDVDELDDAIFQTGCCKLEPPTCTTNWTYFNSNLTYINNGQITVNNDQKLLLEAIFPLGLGENSSNISHQLHRSTMP